MFYLTQLRNHFYNFIKIFGIYLLWIIIYYAALHLHIHLCARLTVFGFIMTPILNSAPHCQALRWVIYNGSDSIVAMWLIFGTWIMQYIKPITR